MSENRYAPAIHAKWSKNISIEKVNVYHALGMGFLGEHTENIHLNSLYNVRNYLMVQYYNQTEIY